MSGGLLMELFQAAHGIGVRWCVDGHSGVGSGVEPKAKVLQVKQANIGVQDAGDVVIGRHNIALAPNLAEFCTGVLESRQLIGPDRVVDVSGHRRPELGYALADFAVTVDERLTPRGIGQRQPDHVAVGGFMLIEVVDETTECAVVREDVVAAVDDTSRQWFELAKREMKPR